MRIPPLEIKILLESNPPKSRILVKRLAALMSCAACSRPARPPKTQRVRIPFGDHLYMYRPISFSLSLYLSIYLSIYLFTDSIRGSSVEFGTIRRRLAWPLRKDDTYTSKSVNIFVMLRAKAQWVAHNPKRCLDLGTCSTRHTHKMSTRKETQTQIPCLSEHKTHDYVEHIVPSSFFFPDLCVWVSWIKATG